MPNPSDRPVPRRRRPNKKSSARSAQLLASAASLGEAIAHIIRAIGRL
jgi:hypothetical protein